MQICDTGKKIERYVVNLKRDTIYAAKLCGGLVRWASGRSDRHAIRGRPVLRSRSTTRLSVSSFHPCGDVEGKEKGKEDEEEEKTREKEGRRVRKREILSLVADSPFYEGTIERRNVVVVPGSVCTDEGERWGEVR